MSLTFIDMVWRKIRSLDLYWTFASSVATPFLRLLDAETAHDLSIKLLQKKMAPVEPRVNRSSNLLNTEVFGAQFANPLGLAAGYDKQAQVVLDLFDMGFGFVEVGGVTPKPQLGNEKPRLFRLKEDLSIINRFGLNSEGHAAVANRLAKMQGVKRGVVGVNIAKNTASSDTIDDYIKGVQSLGSVVDFIVLNVSCPNVSWTADMQKNGDEMLDLVSSVKKARDNLGALKRPSLLLKLGPDMDFHQKEHMAHVALSCGIDGLVVSNTTNARPKSLKSEAKKEKGGLSGPVLKDAALETLKDMYRLTNHKIPIIGVGGISNAADAYERIRAGASLVQIYTSLVYNGPAVILQIKRELRDLLVRDGFDSVSAAVGVDARQK